MQKELNQHATDVILRSSDKKLFYSWKTFLSISSPVFSDLFTLPQPRPDTSDNIRGDDGLPVIDLEEDSRTLGHILALCHPPSCTKQQFKVNSLRELRAVLEATMKYEMEDVRRVALEELFNPSLLHEDPLAVYALACQYERQEAAESVAKHTLARPSLVREYVPELENIHAGKLCRLLLYREACITVACSLATDHTWIVYRDIMPLFGCHGGERCEDMGSTMVRNVPSRKYPCGREELKSVHKWWLEYMTKSAYALQRSPHGSAVKDHELVDDVLMAISTSGCKGCDASLVSETFRSFVHIFAENIERRIGEVEINLGF